MFQFDPAKKGRTYSKGNRQKVALIAAFVTPAELYILDEPTSGLDPLMEAVFNQEVQRISRDGSTVLLSSHILSEVEQLCDRVSIIRAGRTVETGTLSDLRHLTRTAVSFGNKSLAGLTLAELATRILRVTTLPRASQAAGVSFTADSDALVDVLPVLAELRVQGLTVAPPSLEELFLSHYHEAAPEQAPAGTRS